jgi:pimeloyl-ACP methyl ester carboxylesterase
MTTDRFQAFHYPSDDGLNLYGRDYAPSLRDELPIVCLAGLSRNSRDFHSLALKLTAEGQRVITLDYRGRGLSDWDSKKANYNIVREAQDVTSALDHLDIPRASFIGTSRGGLILHIMAMTARNRIAGIVLNDIGPVIEVEGLRRIRDYLSQRSTFATAADVAKALEHVHGKEFPVLRPADWLEMAEALYRQTDAGWTADFDPALVDPLKTMDFSVPLPDMWQQYESMRDAPLMIIRGEFSTLLAKATVSEMIERQGTAKAISAVKQGHAPLLHLEGVYAPLAAFLKSIS